jgi:hypothetical protein
MGILSSQLTRITFGTNGAVYLQQASISATNGSLSNLDSPSANGLNLAGPDGFKAVKVWNSVWNDVADFQLLADKLEFGKCYFDTKDGARICTERCQMSVIGIASDTFGFGVGSGANPEREVPIAVAGWVLAHVDQEYECGTPLTNDQFGNLTAITRAEKLEYPERIVAIYKRKEMDKQWGPEGQKIEVNGRHWVKVK